MGLPIDVENLHVMMVERTFVAWKQRFWGRMYNCTVIHAPVDKFGSVPLLLSLVFPPPLVLLMCKNFAILLE